MVEDAGDGAVGVRGRLGARVPVERHGRVRVSVSSDALPEDGLWGASAFARRRRDGHDPRVLLHLPARTSRCAEAHERVEAEAEQQRAEQ